MIQNTPLNYRHSQINYITIIKKINIWTRKTSKDENSNLQINKLTILRICIHLKSLFLEDLQICLFYITFFKYLEFNYYGNKANFK